MRLSLPRIIVAVLALAAPAVAERLDFPSDGLESRVEFWKKVYTQYGENDVIIHDRIHPNLIYDVATRADQADKIAAVQKALDEISANLANPQQLSVIAEQVRASILAGGLPLTVASIADLKDNVHTQVGIKERFRQGVIRSGRYVDTFQSIFEK